MSSPGHEIQSFFTSYLVPHFPEVWKCGKVRQSKDIVSLSPSHDQHWTFVNFPLECKQVIKQVSEPEKLLAGSRNGQPDD